MSLLLLIWYVSLLLAGAALGTMIGLIFARFAMQRRALRLAERRRKLVQELLRGSAVSRESLKALPRDLVTDTFVDLIRLVRGDERAQFVQQAAALGVPEQLGRRARSRSARKRLNAVQSLGHFSDEDSLRILHRSVEDPNDDVRLAAALSLAEAGRSDEIHALVDRLHLGTEQNSMMMVSLFRFVAEDRADEIRLLALDTHVNAEVRVAAIEALASTGDYSLVPTIVDLALSAHDDAEELPHYLRALGELAHPAAAPAIMDGLHRQSTGARAAAAGAAGKIRLHDAGTRLAELLDDPEWWVRFRAAEALMRLGTAGIARLRTAATTGSPAARDAATGVLAEHGTT